MIINKTIKVVAASVAQAAVILLAGCTQPETKPVVRRDCEGQWVLVAKNGHVLEARYFGDDCESQN